MSRENNPHLKNIVNKVIKDFEEKVEKEESLANLLLKGHLFIENLLEEILAVFDFKVNELSSLSFSKKVNCLREIANSPDGLAGKGIIKKDVLKTVQLLSALNGVRNDLAHDLHFNISEASVNKIGLLLGSKFIMKKYESGYDQVKENLLFCLREIVGDMGEIIYIKMDNLKFREELAKKGEQVSLPAKT